MRPRDLGEGKQRKDGDPVLPPPPDGLSELEPAVETSVARESMAERTERLDRKIAAAYSLLRTLHPTDGRARLLSSAIFRRDEVLLDAVLSSMSDAFRDIIEFPELVRRTRRPR